MSRFIVCDVCDRQFDADVVMGAVQLPTDWIPTADEGELVILDVCSVECLTAMAVRLGHGHQPGEESMNGDQTDPGHDRDARSSGTFTPVEDRPTFQSPVRVKTRSEHD